VSREFTKNIEDFVCENCGANIEGNGYTNHCSQCLYSKHVDIHPGDRASNCGGLMEPIEVTQESDSYTLTHKCKTCGHAKKNKLAQDDNMDEVVEIARKLAKKNLE